MSPENMSVGTSLALFVVAAALLTITPGLDTALVLRTAAVEGPRRAFLAALGIACGCLTWGAAVALGLGALLAASQAAYTVLKWAGAVYLAWLGINLILRPRSKFELTANGGRRGNAWLRGFLTNLLNPKIGVFYVSFLPQFTPAGVPAGPFIFLLAAIHVALGLPWCALLIAATAPLKRWLANAAVVRWLDRATGAVFLGFGARLALERR
jgi:threonine/homoserine/homoserine lactone efflux protein